MQSNESSELNSSSTNNNRRRRRPRNRRNKKHNRNGVFERDRNEQRGKKDVQKHVKPKEQNLSLTESLSEAHALEKQLAELQTQLKINYSNVPSKEQGRVASAIAAEQIAATEEEINYVRNSLRKTYRHIISIDLIYAITHHIEDKLWRYIFYARIEDIRSKLRKLNPEDAEKYKMLQKTLSHRIDSAFKFYRDLNNTIKADYHIDTKALGIDLFLQKATIEEKLAILLQSNYICMGDLARYHAQQAILSKNTKKISDFWSLAKTCYLKAIDVYRKTGKPYSQLALVSISNGNAMEIVWYYCMSLAVKYPSSVGRDNLKSFYSKIRFNSKQQKADTVTEMVSAFVESFLHMHRTVMFSQKETEEFGTMLPIVNDLGNAFSSLILNTSLEKEEEAILSKSTMSTLHIIRTTITRTITILMISTWIANDRLKDKANYNIRPIILASQIHMYIFAFQLLTTICRSSQQALDEVKSKLNAEKYKKLESLVEETILPGLSIWSTYLYTNIVTIAQWCMTAATDTRNREPEKKTLVKSIQSLLSLLINHPSFLDPVVNILPATYPLSEDLTLLGVLALSPFHSQVDFFKENVYEVLNDNSPEARKQVRWGRIRLFIKKLADSSSFNFIQYNQSEQNYSVIDENAKRQQQNRFMKALATQRLIEQVSSLERNVNRISLGNKRNHPIDLENEKDEMNKKRNVYTCVIDVTSFLDGLSKVKKWANQTLNVDRRSQTSILEVVVPLDVIDALDNHKKGSSHMNMQARESIRFLDQKLLENSKNKSDAIPTTSFLRTQKVTEKLNNWSEAEAFWIGEESRSNIVDVLLSEGEEEEKDTDPDAETESDMESISSDEDLFKSRRRDEDESSEYEESEYDDSEIEENEIASDEEANAEEYNYEDFAEEEIPYTLNDVPKSYRPILSCLLYYYSKQQEIKDDEPSHLVLVTNDEDLAWWAELFGNPKTRKRLMIKTVNEWDQMVNNWSYD
ncbi:uncharacterized protein BX663DRAFT_461889 [Cokeromyces recurvatus]|uniref:uncharacterized protein n=1 Tax=Cokeromyces recurvatus TaxID=90255 RepID=UPI0022204477|nr:uncharacterized protein BX663DRAFT_461889 [Cokeromyces recurvatus]KAI7898506.1 hypothetical protein BX663DRAFT_461889 [Cokeromyces recurvatus]